LAPFADVTSIEPEVRRGESRLDFRLDGPRGVSWVEVKSVTLVEDGLALFPDAPTLRGRRHLEELMSLAQKKARAAIVFVVQRPDAAALAPHRAADPAFARALVDAARAGVETYAFRCAVTRQSLYLTSQLPVLLSDPETA
ncbi:MAG: DNA/RNA nuclease SfsA, partial [Anaerolineae bacterium]